MFIVRIDTYMHAQKIKDSIQSQNRLVMKSNKIKLETVVAKTSDSITKTETFTQLH